MHLWKSWVGKAEKAKALLVPLHPPGGLKFSSHCSVHSYTPLRSLRQGGPLVKMTRFDIFMWNHVHSFRLLWCRGDSGRQRREFSFQTSKMKCRDKVTDFLVFPGQAGFEVYCVPSPVRRKGASPFTWGPRQKTCTSLYHGLSCWLMLRVSRVWQQIIRKIKKDLRVSLQVSSLGFLANCMFWTSLRLLNFLSPCKTASRLSNT